MCYKYTKFHKRLNESANIIEKLIKSFKGNDEEEVRLLIIKFNETLVDSDKEREWRDGINKKLLGVKDQIDRIKQPKSKLFKDCPNKGDCEIIFILKRLKEIEKINELSLPNPTVPFHTAGLYLPTGFDKYPKNSVLISDDIFKDNDEFEQTFIHEHTHAILHKTIGNVILKNKGLNEGFAVAMEYFYAKDEGLKFNEKRCGEYLAHQILTVLEEPKKPWELFEELKKKKWC